MVTRCQRCDLTKESNYNNETCPRCGSHMFHIPVWINGKFF